MGKEDAEAFLADTFGSAVLEQLGATVWKARLEGADTVLSQLDSIDSEDVGVRTCMALALIPGWKDSNFQVSRQLLNASGAHVTTVHVVTKACCSCAQQ